MTSEPNDIDGLLHVWRDGDQEAWNRIIPLIYGELRRLMHVYMFSEHNNHALQAVVVNESYIRFLAPFCQRIRRVLVDDALAAPDTQKSPVVEPRFFGRLSLEEAAGVLKISADTLWRDWDLGKGSLYREMKGMTKRQP